MSNNYLVTVLKVEHGDENDQLLKGTIQREAKEVNDSPSHEFPLRQKGVIRRTDQKFYVSPNVVAAASDHSDVEG